MTLPETPKTTPVDEEAFPATPELPSTLLAEVPCTPMCVPDPNTPTPRGACDASPCTPIGLPPVAFAEPETPTPPEVAREVPCTPIPPEAALLKPSTPSPAGLL